MQDVFNALAAALKSLFHPKMLALVLWPMLFAASLWIGIAIFFWSDWVVAVSSWLSTTPAEEWLLNGFLAAASGYFITFILVMLLIPLIYVTALVITAVFAMPTMVNHVATRNYPALQRARGGTFWGSVINSVIAIGIYCIGWLLTLPLWLFSLFAAILPVILAAYLNQRLFRYDALADHASQQEFDQVMERAGGKLYLLGALAGLLQFIPVLNFFSPVYIGLAFIHLCLAELEKLRASTGSQQLFSG